MEVVKLNSGMEELKYTWANKINDSVDSRFRMPFKSIVKRLSQLNNSGRIKIESKGSVYKIDYIG
jgi:hypothetical protein